MRTLISRTLGLLAALGFMGAAQQSAPPAAGTPGAPGGAGTVSPEQAAKWKDKNLWQLKTVTLDGKPADLAQYKGKVALVVNVASKCGYTPQYEGLQKLYEKYKDRGLVVLGFPSNDFGGQEPGTAAEIQDFCTKNYSVTFPLFQKIQTKPGSGQCEIYDFLCAKTGKLPTWNFCKYLVGKDGQVISYYDKSVTPKSDDLVKAIEAALAASQ